MSEELGKIEKPLAEEFKKGRRLYFVPLVYRSRESSAEYIEIYRKYWSQVENQVAELELKLGKISKIYHELIPVGGEDGFKVIKDLNEGSCQIVESRLDKDAQLEAVEESELLTEFMDWSKCLLAGLQNQKVLTHIYESYVTASKKRSEHIARQIDETLGADGIGILFMTEGHQVQFSSDIQVFYVAPPALDDINRWLRDRGIESSGEGEAGEKGSG